MSREPISRRSLKSFCYIILTGMCLILIQSAVAFGQVDEGSITGTIQDPSGAVVPGARVTLVNTDQGFTLETTSNSSGEYSFSPLKIGNYSVTVTAAGFSTTTQQHLNVVVGQPLRVDLRLTTGAATETVQVTTTPPQLQSTEASVGQVIGEKSVNSLPLNGRNFTFLAQVSAGVNTPQADTRGNAASGAFTANGLRPDQNNYLLDGIDNNSNAVDFLNGTNFIILPPVDAIQEFKVQTSNFSAEYGRSAGAVLNATVKAGTNSFHGAAWEFFRNDKLDAADYFETAHKGELRQNQFGGSVGGPILKNKIFFFGDYEGLRRVQGNTQSGLSVPTVAERASNYTNLSDIISGTARADALGRLIVPGTILDPATTRSVAAGAVDPVTGLQNASSNTVYVRDPFGLGSCASTALSAPTLAACPGLNQLPPNRLDQNAIKLLNLFPNPTGSGISSNFTSSPNLFEHRNQFDARGDYDANDKNQVFFRFSYEDDPNFIPGPFSGIADGGGFQEGLQTAKSQQGVAGYTHVFNPSAVNVVHAGINHLHTTRYGPGGSVLGTPAQYGITGIPQVAENGGLPAISISGLSTLGSNSFLPSDEVSQTLQVADDFTKIYGQHSFRSGIEYQDVKLSVLQPAYSRGTYSYNTNSSSVSFTDIPNVGGGATGRAQFLLTPELSTVPNGVNYVGGSDQVQASNISKNYDTRYYLAAYFQDDWKVSPNLTLNMGVRWDYFSPISESNGAKANFIESGPPFFKPVYLLPATGKASRQLSSTANNPALQGNGFIDLLAKDGIALEETDRYGHSVTQTQKTNFAPRLGFAYQATPKFVTRGGFGLSYNSFENLGYGPNVGGGSYPFTFNFNYNQPNLPGYIPSVTPISTSTPWAGCATAGPGNTATLNSGFSCIGFSPLAVNAQGLGLPGVQFNFKTPRTLSSNLSLQYSVTNSLSVQVAYVLTNATNLETGVGNNLVSQILPANASTSNYVPFPDFGQNGGYSRTVGRSVYNGLLMTVEEHLSNGLNYLFTYTYSKTLTDSIAPLNSGNIGNYRAPDVPGAGIRYDWGPATFDIRNVFHASGGYELPIGKGKRFLGNAGKFSNAAVGGWSANWLATVEGGQPLTLACPSTATAGTGCYDVPVRGQSQKLGVHHDSNGKLSWFGNPAAFQQPCLLQNVNGQAVPETGTPVGCVPLSGLQALGGGLQTTNTPGVTKFDFSLFKSVPITERVSMQFRAEFFNVLNHPNFNAPGFGGNGVVAIPNSTNFTNSNFGEIGSTRDAPYDPRQIQFALKLYY